MRTVKNTLCLVLAVLMLLSMLPMAASAAEAESRYTASAVAVNPTVASDVQGAASTCSTARSSIPMTVGEFQQLMLTNKERLANGLDPLSTFASLQEASDVRAVEIDEYFSHTRPDGTSCGTVLDDYGIGWNWRGENIAYGYNSAASVTNGWMNSEGHRANILNENFTHLGVGLYEGVYGLNWVQTFVSYYGSDYTQAYIMYVPSVTVGTDYEETYSYAVLNHSYYGECFLPISNEFLCGYDAYTVGTHHVTVSLLGFEWNLDITVEKEPTPLNITSQPEDVTVSEGQTASVTVEAEGDGLTYAWYYKDTDDSAFTLTTAFTGNTYAVTMNAARNGRQVYCVVSDQHGNSVQSATATIRMGKAAAITGLTAAATAPKGQNATITVKATGDGLTYEWYFKDAGASKYTKTASFTGKTYSIAMTAARDGRKVYCVVRDCYGNSVRSEVVTLHMGNPAAIVTQPKTGYAQSGATVKTTVKATGDGLTYQWYIKNADGTKYSKSSVTSATYSCTMNAAAKGRRVYCVITDKYGNSVQTKTVLLRMSATITGLTNAATAPAGKNATITLKTAGDGLTYEWYYKDVGASKYYKTTAFTGKTYSVPMNAARDGRKVYCVVTDKYGNTVTSKTVTLHMGNPATITRQPSGVTVAEGANATVSLKATGDGLTYAWYYRDAGTTKYYKTTAFTGSTYKVPMTAARDGRQVYCVVTDKYGNSVRSNTVTIRMAD